MGIQKPFQFFSHSIILFIFPFLLCLCRAELSGQFSITGYDPEDLQSGHQVAEIFRQWRENHRKTYQRPGEMMKRFDNFKRNLKYVVERNSNRTGQSVGLNRFADLTNEEFREMYLGNLKRRVRLSERRHTRQSSVQECDAPRSLDWRKKGAVTAVKNQGDCGSCWAFSATGAIEGINAISTGELISLSEQELVSCDTTQDGCDGGDMGDAFAWVISNGGIDTEADYPYTGVDSTCATNKEVVKAVNIDGYENVAESDSALLCATVNQPISVGLVASSIDFQLYTGGIFEGYCSSNPDDIDHAVLIVGYGSQGDVDYWIVKNSWGTDWGVNGYIYIRRNTNLTYGVCAINAMASYPTQAVSAPSPCPSPSSPPPPSPPPTPTACGDFTYCQPSQTCCCLYEFFDFCLIYGCCPYTDAVCCAGTDFCCPSEFPICHVDEGMCLKKSGDSFGVAAKKKKWANHKLPWSKLEQRCEITYEPLQWRVNHFAALR